MPRGPGTKKDKPSFIEEARRAQVVAAAKEIFLHNGFEKTTIADIAKAIDVSKGVILYHFGNKSDLGKAVIEEILGRYGAHITEKLGKLETATEKVLSFPLTCAKYIQDNRNDFILYVDTLGSFGDIEQKRSYMASANKVQRDYLIRLIEKAKSEGGVSSVNAQSLADTIQAFVDGINSQFCADPGNVSPMQAAKLFRKLLDDSIKN